MKAFPHVSVRSAFAAALLAGASVSQAAIFQWNNVSANWSTGINWSGGIAPISAPDNELIFGSAATPFTATHDLGPAFNLNILRLNSTVTTGILALNAAGGSTLSFVNNGAVAPALIQQGTGAYDIDIPISLDADTTFRGTAGPGLVSLLAPISGFSTLAITGGNWRLGDVASSWGAATTISGGAIVELKAEGTGNVSINFAGSAGTGILGTNNTVNVDGGVLKLTTQGTGSIALGTNRVVAFGTNGGTFSMVNTNPAAATTHAGQIASGDLGLALNNAPGQTAVVQFNGGQVGLSQIANPFSGDWSVGGNVLRFNTVTGTGALRVELTNGAMVRGGISSGGIDSNFAAPVTVRGVVGGDPTSGAAGTASSGVSTTTGRFLLDYNRSIFSAGLTFEGAMQVLQANRTSALNGNITIAGTAGGNAGYVAFGGRGTGTALTSAINAVGANVAGQNVLYIGEDTTSSSLTVQGGGTAAFDARLRIDQPNNHGVLMVANTTLQPGGALRVAQSMSNFSGAASQNTASNVGDILLRGNVIAQGSTAAESTLDILLPTPDAAGTTLNGVPVPLSATSPAAGSRPFGGLVAEASHNLVINGTGFGGLRVNALARPDRLFSATGAVGGASMPDPTPNTTKINGYLTAARIGAITGSGGYLTPAPAGATYTMPNAEWAAGVPVGLKVVNSNTGGVDLAFDAAKTSWGHNLAVDAGAELSTGALPFTLSAGTLSGTGTLSGAGGLRIASGATVSPGFANIGTLKAANLTIDGTFLANFSNTAANDLLSVTGNLILGAAGIFQAASGSTFSGNYTILTYSGTLLGTFATVTGLPAGYSLNYSTPGQIRAVFGTIGARTWAGTPGAKWSTSAADTNWQGGLAFTDGDSVTFDDTATGSTTITLGGVVQPGQITFNNPTKNYTVNAPTAGDSIGGTTTLTKQGAGTLTLNGTHTFTGGTTISGGRVILANNDVLPNTGATTVSAGATLDLNGKTDKIAALTVTGTVTAGNLSVAALTLEDGASVAANLILEGGLSKNGVASSTLAGTIDLSNGSRTVTVAAGAGPELTLSGVVSNGALIKAGEGRLLLGKVNTYAGGTTVNAGVLTAGVAGAIPSGTLIINGGAVDMGGFAYTATSLSGTGGTLSMGGAALSINAAANASFGAAIIGAGTVVTKLGAGVQTLSGASSFDGGLVISAGRVNLNAAGSAGTGPVTVSAGTGLQSGAAIANNITLNGGVLSAAAGVANVTSGILQVASASTIDIFNRDNNANADVILLGTLSGTGNLNVVVGSGQAAADGGTGFRLRGTTASDYSGTVSVPQKGKFEIQMNSSSAPNPLGAGRIVMAAGTSTGELNGTYSQLQPRLAGTGQIHPLGNDVEISGPGYVNVNMLGGTDVVAQFGNLKIGAGQILGSSKNDAAIRNVAFSSVTLTGGNAEFRAFDPAFGQAATAARGGANIRLGAIAETAPGSGIIFKAGTGYRNEIEGVAAYTGPTQVASGMLRVSVSGSLASSPQIDLALGATLDVTPYFFDGYTIPLTQTLSGDGDWDGRIVLAGKLAPGTGALGTMTGDDLTFQGGARLQFELSKLDNSSDRLSLIGAFDKGSAGVFGFDFQGGGLAGQTYTLAQFSSTSFLSSDFSFTNLANGLAARFQMTPTELQLVVVPEPGAAFSLLAGAGILLGMSRRRRSSPRAAGI